MQQKYIWAFIGTFALVTGLGAVFLFASGTLAFPTIQPFRPTKTTTDKPDPSSPAFLAQHVPSDIAVSVGPKNARVTVVEFLDFQCPFCKESHPTLLRLLDDYKNMSVRFEFRHFPIVSIHPFALPAALASLCANEQGKFLEFYDMAYTRQDAISMAGLSTFAQDLNLNLAAFNACMAEKRYEPFVKKDVDDAIALGIEGTPTWFVNTTRLVGALPYETFKQEIDKALGK